MARYPRGDILRLLPPVRGGERKGRQLPGLHERVVRPTKETEARNCRYRRRRRRRHDGERETRGRFEIERRRGRNGWRRRTKGGKKVRLAVWRGTARHKPLLGKPNLRGTQNAEAILRTYHRSRLRPPSPSSLPSRPPPGLSTLSTEERRGGGAERVSRISPCTLLTGILSLLYHPSCPSWTQSLLFHLTSIVSQTWKRSVGRASRNYWRPSKKCIRALHRPSHCHPLPASLFLSLFLSRESVSDLENPDRAPGRGSNRYPRIHRI